MKFRIFHEAMLLKLKLIRYFFALGIFFWEIRCQELSKNVSPTSSTSITRQMKQFIMMSSSYMNQTISYPQRRVESVRRQRVFPPDYPFPCANSTNLGRSYRRPLSVHKLRPGDIDVVGAMGDSLVAGNGALEEYAIGTVIEYRGVSWCAGGEGTWRQYLTLPNILKEFNANLKGYSRGKGEFLSKNSGMNVAFPVSADADAVTQAKYLVKKMKAHPNIDYYNDWKMITIFFGANDLCSSQCFNKEGTSAIQHRRKLMEALDYLYANLPRTFVNLIPVLDVTVSVRQKRSMMCRFLHRLFCTCFHTGSDVNEFDIITQLVLDYQDAEKQLVRSGRYDAKEDFTVVLQPFMTAFNAPLDKAKRYKPFIDKSYITYDCFHFSQKGHALGANMLWNNLLEPVGRKSKKQLDYIMQEFRCPSNEAPYFFTNLNSKAFLTYGTQLYNENLGDTVRVNHTGITTDFELRKALKEIFMKTLMFKQNVFIFFSGINVKDHRGKPKKKK